MTAFDKTSCFFHEFGGRCTNQIKEGDSRGMCRYSGTSCSYYVPTDWMSRRVDNFVKEQAYIYRRSHVLSNLLGNTYEATIVDEWPEKMTDGEVKV